MDLQQTIKPYVIGLDLGGTNAVFGVVDAHGLIKATTAIKTQACASAEDFVAKAVDALQLIVEQVGGIGKIKGMGIGAPNGNFYSGTIERAPNIAWAKGVVPLASMFAKALGIPVAITNDANAAAIGEMAYGVAKGMKNFIMITLGTGVGSGIVVNGQLVYGSDGLAGELGHVIMVREGGRLCGCGRRGCLETYCSATGVARTAREMLAASDEPSLLRGIAPGDITSLDVSGFDTGNMIDMRYMFQDCASLSKITYGDKFGAAEQAEELQILEHPPQFRRILFGNLRLQFGTGQKQRLDERRVVAFQQFGRENLLHAGQTFIFGQVRVDAPGENFLPFDCAFMKSLDASGQLRFAEKRRRAREECAPQCRIVAVITGGITAAVLQNLLNAPGEFQIPFRVDDLRGRAFDVRPFRADIFRVKRDQLRSEMQKLRIARIHERGPGDSARGAAAQQISGQHEISSADCSVRFMIPPGRECFRKSASGAVHRRGAGGVGRLRAFPKSLR